MTDITRTLNDEGIASPKGKLWGKTSVDAILINEAYTGTLLWGMNAKDMADPVRLEKAFPVIVTKAQFRRVNELMRSRASSSSPGTASRSAVPVEPLTTKSISNPLRFSISAWPMNTSLACFPLRISHASGSVLLSCVSFFNLSPRKSTDGLLGQSSDCRTLRLALLV